MSEVKIYHNPRCSKSRQTLALLEEQNLKPEIVLYLQDTPSKEQLKQLLGKLGIQARDLLRKKEAEYKENGLQDESLADSQILDAMLKYPKLIERPIVETSSKAAIGRPPEAVLAIL